ncbi:MAG: helix-turn-helix domain-containing protein [Lachnospiraceae bacterium]|nr:helix-turn-helix domain-containing protein [Lachnospiraceae bacterium]
MRKKNIIEIKAQTKDDSEKLVMMNLAQKDLADHGHHFFELAYVTGGTVQHTLNGSRSFLKKGDYFIVDYGSSHSYEKSQNLTLINCLFLPEIIDETLQGCESLDQLLHACLIRYYRMTLGEAWADRIFHDVDGKVEQLLYGMLEEYREKKLGSAEIFRCRLTEILILTLRMLVQSEKKYPESTAVTEVIRYVDGHYREPLTLQNFCERNHYSLPYISRRFKQEAGMTFREYLQKTRMEKCCELLAGSDMTVNEIARAVGYEDTQFFHEIFKRFLHMTPREYRRLRKNAGGYGK